MLLPLVTYPYLIRVLGANIYGKIVFAQAIITYLSIIINFGFNISATKDVAQYRENYKKLGEVVSSVLIIKAILWIVALLILMLLIMFIPSIKADWDLYILTFGITINEFLFAQWYFQGREKMRYITIINVASKSLFTVLIFIGVKSKSDYLLVPAFNTAGAFLGGIASIYVIRYLHKIKFSLQRKKEIKYYFLESIPLFISVASVQVYVNANRVLVGTFLGMGDLAYYDLGEKILRLLKIPVSMLGQASFPSIVRAKNIKLINRFLIVGFVITLLLVSLVYVFSGFIVNVIGGESMHEAIWVMRGLSISAIPVAISQFLGSSRLIVFGYKKNFTQIVLSSGLFFGVLCVFFYFLNYLNLIGFTFIAVATEFWVMGLMFFICYKKRLLW